MQTPTSQIEPDVRLAGVRVSRRYALRDAPHRVAAERADPPARGGVPVLRSPAFRISGGLALVLAVWLLWASPMGTDLPAQIAHANFVRAHGWTPVDLRWYGGNVQFGYSWLSPTVMALLSPTVTGVLALMISTIGFTVLLLRCGAARPVAGSVLGALAFAGNLVSGRVTFALGVAFGLWALAALTLPNTGRWSGARIGLAAAGAAVASATSPVAGLFLAMAGAAIMIARNRLDGAILAGAAGLPLVLTAVVVPDSGTMPINGEKAFFAALASLGVAGLVRVRVIRIGALFAAAGVLGAFLVASPVGINATRLTTIFALPLTAAYAPAPAWLARRFRRSAALAGGWLWLAAALVALAVCQPPVMRSDLADTANPAASRAYFAPLLRELARRDPIGRIEIPPTRDRWEAAYVADTVPLARGWLTQTDHRRNRLFFRNPLNPDDYEAWLRDNGVSYVALPDVAFATVGGPEAALVRGGLPYLEEIWRARHWVLYRVTGDPSVVVGGTLVAATATELTFDVATPGEVLVRVTPSRWLRVRGPAAARLHAHGRWSVVRVSTPGRYAIFS